MLIHDVDPNLPIPPYERTACGLCNAALTRRNCRWGVLPGICLDCAPLGIVHHVNRHSSRQRPPPRPPLGWVKRLRLCRCSRKLARRRRMCDACRDAVRRATWRQSSRQYRAARASTVRSAHGGEASEVAYV